MTNPSIRGSFADSLVPPLETPVAGRPIVNASLALNYGINALDPTGYHLWNLAVHIASALLLFAIVRRTLSSRPRRLFPHGAVFLEMPSRSSRH